MIFRIVNERADPDQRQDDVTLALV